MMERRASGLWQPSRWARLLGRATHGSLQVAGDEIVIVSGEQTSAVHLSRHWLVRVERGMLWWRVQAPDAAPVRGFSSKSINDYRGMIERAVAKYDAKLVCQEIELWWSGFQAALGDAWAERRWFTEEMIVNWENLQTTALQNRLSTLARAALRSMVDREAWDAVQSASLVRERARGQNAALVEAELCDERHFFDSIENTPLTDEQARAVICSDNRVLLVASAGSGKTSTIIARAGWTVHRSIARPEEVLLLAYNRAAANEMAERLTARFKAAGIPSDGLEAQTFHAFGLRVIGEATGRKPRLAAGLDDDNGIPVLARIVTDLRRSSLAFARNWWIMQNLLGVPLDDEEGLEPDSHDRDARQSGFRALDGTVVKSAGERAIANWLIQCGIEVRYEQPYATDVSDARHSQYRPDFYYPAGDIWHEHWAFVDGDRLPPSFAGYLESRAWKKALHEEHGTILIETSASQLTDGTLFDSLESQLRAHGITPDFDPNRKVSGQPLLTEREMRKLFRTFLTHVKNNRMDDADLRARVRHGRTGLPNWREATFLDLFAQVRAEWDRELRARSEIDFEDMLNEAIDAIESGRWVSPYRVVLVDELQDASHARARMVQALMKGPDRYLFAVGDDWQSIYRFAGADITAMTRFEEAFGRGHVLKLERTFRNSQELSTIAGDFVMRNPAQLRKTVRSAISNPAPITLVRVENDAAVTGAIVDRLDLIRSQLAPGARARVKVLGRYRRAANLLPRRRYDRLDVAFQTVHGSKGLEADHVIVVELDRGAFPSTKEDDPLLRLAMPDADSFRFAEERRLFYVALTRARESVLLIARKDRESEFVVELINRGVFEAAMLDRSGGAAVVCHKCGKGLMVQRNGPWGVFLGCTRFPACDGKA